MNRVRMLIHFGITPYLVFDGDNLPSKAGTEKERRDKRKESRTLGLELLKVGKTSQAHLELQKSVDVTPEMARMLIEELKHHNIQYVVAPYEADPELVYLEKKGIIQGILSEDSDMLVFGAKCLITKLDKYGECVEVNRNHFTACREVSLSGWSDADFRRMTILSGCDYLPSIGGMGLKTAYRMLRKYKTVARVVKAVQFDGKFKVPSDYLENFYQAENTFIYPWVYCPTARKLLHLTTPTEEVDITKMPYIGLEVSPDLAWGVARGELHPRTKQLIVLRSNTKPSGKPLCPPPSRPVPATPAEKESGNEKPIDSYFTSRRKRTPLAELHINLFTPSPSQQALLVQQQNNTGWEAVSAPPTIQRQFPPRAHTAPQPSRRVSSGSILSRQLVQTTSKRSRLCSDSETATPGPKDGETRSRFFEASEAEPSPSLRLNKAAPRKSGLEFELHSDDSIEEAMSVMAELDSSAPSPRKKLRIFKDSFTSSVASDSQSTVLSKSTQEVSQDSQDAGVITPLTSFGTPEAESVFSAPLSKQFQELRSKFSFEANGSSMATPPSSSRPASTESTKASEKTSLRQSTQVEEEFVHADADGGEIGHFEDEILVEATTNTVAETNIEVPASDTEDDPPCPATPSRQFDFKGSEELLVPDSSDVESICSPRKPMLNLGRFAFGA